MKPRKSAMYMGVFYIVGSSVPLMPFIFGASGIYAIITSIILTSISLSIVSIIIALISDTSISKRVTKTLILSIGAAAVTITLGTIARSVFHLGI